MNVKNEIFIAIDKVKEQVPFSKSQMLRFDCEAGFAKEFSEAFPEEKKHADLLLKSLNGILASNGSPEERLAEFEKTLAPIGKIAKNYTIHCIGHAHIDMNWLWSWPETVAMVNDTFSTVDRLMEEFPGFKFSQSQTSVFQILKDYLPELEKKVKKRVKEGRFEVIASEWVEGDKNMASGEILARHQLYTKHFFKNNYGFGLNDVQMTFNPDTFGHANSLPNILTKANIKYYYLHRGIENPRIFKWQGLDGSEVLVVNDYYRGYNGCFTWPGHENSVLYGLMQHVKETMQNDFAFVYGVGDHGGGPTRQDIRAVIERGDYPIYPTLIFSTHKAYFEALEKNAKNLPTVVGEINHVFEGCYTSQSTVKYANRKSENLIPQAEYFSLLGEKLAKIPYAKDSFDTSWRHAMFNQFHDILPGSGIAETYKYANGLFQEILSLTTMAKTRALRAIAKNVDTLASAFAEYSGNYGDATSSQAAGMGSNYGQISKYNMCAADSNPIVVFNNSPWERKEIIQTAIWNRLEWKDELIKVRDDKGNTLPAQIVYKGVEPGEWYERTVVAFPVTVPAGGYASYTVARSTECGKPKFTKMEMKGNYFKNEFLTAKIDQITGGVISLKDNKTSYEYVEDGSAAAQLEYFVESPSNMSAWCHGIPSEVTVLKSGSTGTAINGDYLVSKKVHHKFGTGSSLTLMTTMSALSAKLDFQLEVDWREFGSRESGIPSLAISFPLNLKDTKVYAETPNGYVTKTSKSEDLPSYTAKHFEGSYFNTAHGSALVPGIMPAQRYIDVTGKGIDGKERGVTLVNDCKYGFKVDEGKITMFVLRSSFDPDNIPDIGRHIIKFSLIPHDGPFDPIMATRAGINLNQPMETVGVTEQKGTLPAQAEMMNILTDNIMLSGIKQAETDSKTTILRVYEMTGKKSTGKIKINPAFLSPKTAVVVDILEEPTAKNTVKIKGDVLEFTIQPYETLTIALK